jgi:hypothetical protein
LQHFAAQDRRLQDPRQLAASLLVDVLVDPGSHESPRSIHIVDAESAGRALHGVGMLDLSSIPMVVGVETGHQFQRDRRELAGALAQVGPGGVEAH